MNADTWLLSLEGPQEGAWLMATDEALVDFVARTGQRVLRFYAWQRPTLSLGYAQRVSRSIDRAEAERLGLDVVRRPSGGGAVCHDDEVTYSIFLPEADLPGDIRLACARISRGLARGLKLLGAQVDAVLQPGKSDNPVCFAVPGAFELTAHGKKLVGSAQWRKRGVAAQHGSIPLRWHPEHWLSVFPAAFHSAFFAHAIALNELLPEQLLDTQRVRDALVEGFAKDFGISFAPFVPDASYQAFAEQAYLTRHTQSDWIWREGAWAWGSSTSSVR